MMDCGLVLSFDRFYSIAYRSSCGESAAVCLCGSGNSTFFFPYIYSLQAPALGMLHNERRILLQEMTVLKPRALSSLFSAHRACFDADLATSHA